jgi:hypothetical protein
MALYSTSTKGCRIRADERRGIRGITTIGGVSGGAVDLAQVSTGRRMREDEIARAKKKSSRHRNR